jgi:hypothetical protein
MENTSLVKIDNSKSNEIIQFLKDNKYYIAGLLIVIGGAGYYIYILKKQKLEQLKQIEQQYIDHLENLLF